MKSKKSNKPRFIQNRLSGATKWIIVVGIVLMGTSAAAGSEGDVKLFILFISMLVSGAFFNYVSRKDMMLKIASALIFAGFAIWFTYWMVLLGARS